MSINVVEIDTTDLAVTPFFDVRVREDIQASEKAGHLVTVSEEIVQVRIAGTTNFSPVFPTNAMWKREGNRTVTYAERWPEEYRRFKEGEPQEARGTPLEMLARFGVTPEQLSLCRALRIYSIEQLHQLEGNAAKSLGMNANILKDAARQFMAERMSGAAAVDTIADLQKQIAELKAAMTASTIVPKQDATPEEAQAALRAADGYDAMSEREVLKRLVDRMGGQPPKEKPTREQAISMLRALDSEA